MFHHPLKIIVYVRVQEAAKVQLAEEQRVHDLNKNKPPSEHIPVDTTQFLFKSALSSIPGVVAVGAMKTDQNVAGEVSRFQVPLVLAHAMTVHKAQGQTCSNGVILQVPNKSIFALCYVACSRVKQISKLHLNGSLYETHFHSEAMARTRMQISSEYERLRSLNSNSTTSSSSSSLSSSTTTTSSSSSSSSSSTSS